jgi:hypothetical protein
MTTETHACGGNSAGAALEGGEHVDGKRTVLVVGLELFVGL